MNGLMVYAGFTALLCLSLYLFGLFGRGRKSFDRLARKSFVSVRRGVFCFRERAVNVKTVKRLKLKRVQNEIYEGLSLLRNFICVGGDDMRGDMTGDMVLVKLSKRGGVLEPVYLRMLSFLRLGKNEEARNCMSEFADIPIIMEYASILVDWDRVERETLRETIITFQKSIRQTRETASRRRDEIISDLVYMPAILNVMLIFINFVYVGYFLEQREMLSDIFG